MIILTEVNKNNIFYVNNEKFIYLINNYKNFLINNHNSCYEYIKFKNYYIKYSYNRKLLRIEYFNYSGEYHREYKPALISYYTNGEISIEQYYLNGKLYREDGPTLINYYNREIWLEEYYLNGKRHREDGPAFIHYDENGKIISKSYYLNDKKYFYIIFYFLNYIKYCYKKSILEIKKII